MESKAAGKQNRIVVIGGTACGPKAAARARRCDPQARITIVEQGENLSTATCGLPYYVSGVISSRSEMIARGQSFFRKVMDIEVLAQTRALAVDAGQHRVDVVNLADDRPATIEYDRLVLATGGTPVVPDVAGKGLGGIFTLTRLADADAVRGLLSPHTINKVVIVGAGLIGMEMAESLASQGLAVTVVEALPRVLPALLDFEVAAYVERCLRGKGIEVLLGQRLTGFAGDGKGYVSRVVTDGGELEADLVLLAIGTRPNTALARGAGLALGATGGIAVDEYLRTSDPHIYAGGDCVENTHLVTGEKVLAPLGSTANKHGRVIGTNVTGGQETFPGVLGTALVKVFDCNVGRVGLSEQQARDAGYEVVTSLVPAGEHANYYPGGEEILVKLVAAKDSNRILGGQVVGPGEAAKRVDVLATALTFGATVDDMADIDLGYAPPYNSALDPLHNAANIIRNKQSGRAVALTPMAVMDKIEAGEDFVLLDVRSPGEWQEERLAAPNVMLVPLPELRGQLASLPRDREIVAYCRTSVRAYQAQRILHGAGFKNVKFLDGSLRAWPYETAA